MKLIKDIKAIVFNVRRPHESCLASIPRDGEVEEHEDRYHYWVESEGELCEMTVYKHETISVEILYNNNVN